MTIDNINQTLANHFAKPLPDYYDRRIIFWIDSEREFEDMIDEINIPDVKILKLEENNLFEAKKILSEDDTTSNYLVYDSLNYKKREDNWLRDIQIYSEIFRADLVSMRLEELHIPQTTHFRRAIKGYKKFFASKDRTAKFLDLGTDYESNNKEEQLHIDVMTVLTGAKRNTLNSILHAIICDSLYAEDNQCLEHIKKFGNEQMLFDITEKYTGYNANDDKFVPYDLITHIFLTAFSSINDYRVLSGLDRYISPENQAYCYSFIDEWNSSEDSNKLFDIITEISERMNLNDRIEKLNTEVLLKFDSLPCFDEVIIAKFMKEISENIIKTDEIFKSVEARRSSKWYNWYSYFYNGLYYIAKLQEFHNNNIMGFHFGNYKELWDSYSKEFYKMDTYYRELQIYFRKSLENSSGMLDDLFKDAVSTAEQIYKNYLREINGNWCKLIEDYIYTGLSLEDIPHQYNFYRHFIVPSIHESRVFVIISDALRYEVANELTEKLMQETNGKATIETMHSVFPSITKFGMAALLPHKKLTLTDDMKVLCDGMPTNGTANRDKILKIQNSKNCAVTYETLIAMKQSERRNLVSGADVVYIYHNKIDAIGDKPNTENEVFEACEDTIEELTKLVKTIVNSMGGSNIIITADHGFLYSQEPLDESEKAETELVNGNVFETGRRYMIAENNAKSDILMPISMEELNKNTIGFTPRETIRIKNQGGGSNFVHGGISIQECCVPVIRFKNISKSSKKFVERKKAKLKLISVTRKISNNIFNLNFMQDEAVGGKIIPATYEIYLGDQLSNHVSDVQKVIADKTGKPEERVYKIRFTLKNVDFDGNAPYYLNIVDKETGELIERTEFSVKITFANNFDFF